VDQRDDRDPARSTATEEAWARAHGKRAISFGKYGFLPFSTNGKKTRLHRRVFFRLSRNLGSFFAFRSSRTLSAGTASAASSLALLQGLRLALFPQESPASASLAIF